MAVLEKETQWRGRERRKGKQEESKEEKERKRKEGREKRKKENIPLVLIICDDMMFEMIILWLNSVK